MKLNVALGGFVLGSVCCYSGERVSLTHWKGAWPSLQPISHWRRWKFHHTWLESSQDSSCVHSVV